MDTSNRLTQNNLTQWKRGRIVGKDGQDLGESQYVIKSGQFSIAKYPGSPRYCLFDGSRIVKCGDDVEALKEMAHGVD